MVETTTVARECLCCGEMFPTNRGKYCDACKRMRNNECSLKYYENKRLESGYVHRCIDCGRDISHLSPQQYRCEDCKEDISYKEPIVARTCIICGEIIIGSRRKYCSNKCENKEKIRKSKIRSSYYKEKKKPKKLSSKERQEEIYKIASEYLKKNFAKEINEQKVETLGTFATAGLYLHKNGNKIKRKKDGTPDWKKERKVVDILKKKVYKDKKRHHKLTEGDRIRGYEVEE